jgi:hypothetical protein
MDASGQTASIELQDSMIPPGWESRYDIRTQGEKADARPVWQECASVNLNAHPTSTLTHEEHAHRVATKTGLALERQKWGRSEF